MTFTYPSINKQMPRETLPKKEDDGSMIDYLEEDPEIPTQRYCIISFISPEKVIKQKTQFMNEKFIEWMAYDWNIKGLEHFMAYLSKKYSVKVDDLFKDMEEFKKVHEAEVRKTDVPEQYQIFLLKNEKDLEAKFTESVEFRTNVRGVKVRRIFANLEETQTFARVLQRRYPNDNLYIGKVGAWLPWDPSEHMMPEVEYAEKELNELMRKYKENEVNREIFFEEEKAEKIRKQKEENLARSKKAMEDAKADKGLADTDDIKNALEAPPVHPAEGGIRDL
jgi:hypothetical protein